MCSIVVKLGAHMCCSKEHSYHVEVSNKRVRLNLSELNWVELINELFIDPYKSISGCDMLKCWS